jgi:hypothetical protein
MSCIGDLAVEENKIFMNSINALNKLCEYASPDKQGSEYLRRVIEKQKEINSLKRRVDRCLRESLQDHSMPIKYAHLSEGTVFIGACVGFDLERLERMLPYFNDWEKEGKYKITVGHVEDDLRQIKYCKVMITPTAYCDKNRNTNDKVEQVKLERNSIVAKSNGELHFPAESLGTQDGRKMIDVLAVQLFALKGAWDFQPPQVEELKQMFRVLK